MADTTSTMTSELLLLVGIPTGGLRRTEEPPARSVSPRDLDQVRGASSTGPAGIGLAHRGSWGSSASELLGNASNFAHVAEVVEAVGPISGPRCTSSPTRSKRDRVGATNATRSVRAHLDADDRPAHANLRRLVSAFAFRFAEIEAAHEHAVVAELLHHVAHEHAHQVVS